MDRMDAAGQCFGDPCSHQSSNLSLGIRPAECARVSSGHLFYLTLSYCSSLSSSAAHYEEPVYVQISSEKHCEAGTEKRGGGGAGAGDVEGRGQSGGRGLNKRL